MIRIGKYPDAVNEYGARIVAGLVAVLTLLTLWTESVWLSGGLAYGFLARVLYGPKFSPFGLFASHVIIPFIGVKSRTVAGPPKRFAQFVGLIFSLAGFIFLFLGQILPFQILLSVLLLFSVLESTIGFCAGCYVFALLMGWGLVPQEVCDRCHKLSFPPKPNGVTINKH
ncbi:hypothetical protein CH373_04730 [Leptospira perolatii]|uniref:DUF4395 domain-containing protein n=1 Tax=Leptospira perolatii TaxID=2023191 RepID=A0A2M9ZQH6_9LEPT|nr:DUF4395 domain-containing protein [Leptospira perolatii]PJZ68312.1 hypothetical protein CH360_16865 [Leptospira perolatii]PJZ74221.1 hypothetical protein CH373_04730 [Leptospira perolatii]